MHRQNIIGRDPVSSPAVLYIFRGVQLGGADALGEDFVVMDTADVLLLQLQARAGSRQVGGAHHNERSTAAQEPELQRQLRDCLVLCLQVCCMETTRRSDPSLASLHFLLSIDGGWMQVLSKWKPLFGWENRCNVWLHISYAMYGYKSRLACLCKVLGAGASGSADSSARRCLAGFIEERLPSFRALGSVALQDAALQVRPPSSSKALCNGGDPVCPEPSCDMLRCCHLLAQT